MARSTHAYVRGNTVKFYQWLHASPGARRVPKGPAIWICGDCHLGNLGPINDGDGRVEVQIRDLDQAVVANPAHHLIRLGLSLATAARGSDLPGVATARMIEAMVDGYEAAIRDPDSGDAGPEPDVVRAVRRRALGRALGRGWRQLAKERLEDEEPTIPLGSRFWPIDAAEKEALRDLFASSEVSNLVLSLDHKDRDRTVRLVDAAYWMKGCSSLGLLRFAALVGLKNAKGRSDYALVDLKEAVAPIAPAARGADMPRDPAERVVAAARALAPHLGSRMVATRAFGRSLFLRELAAQDLKLEVDQFTRSQAVTAACYLASSSARRTPGRWTTTPEADGPTSSTPTGAAPSMPRPGCGRASSRSPAVTRRAISTIAAASHWRGEREPTVAGGVGDGCSRRPPPFASTPPAPAWSRSPGTLPTGSRASGYGRGC